MPGEISAGDFASSGLDWAMISINCCRFLSTPVLPSGVAIEIFSTAGKRCSRVNVLQACLSPAPS